MEAKSIIISLIFILCNFIFLYYVGGEILNRISSDLNSDENDFRILGRSSQQEKTYLPEFARYDSLIAFFTALAFFGVIYELMLEDFYSLLVSYQEKFYYGRASLIIAVFLLGTTTAFLTIKNLNIRNKFKHGYRWNYLISTWYLSFVFFATLLSFLPQLNFKYNFIKSFILAFLCGNGFYYIFRQKISINLKSFFKKNNDSEND